MSFRNSQHLLHALYQLLRRTRLRTAYWSARHAIADGRRLLKWIPYFLSGWMPRRNDIWVFGTYRHNFSDNAKYLFLHVSKTRPNVRAVWISRDAKTVARLRALGFEAHLQQSWSGWWYCLRAKCYFFIGYSFDINFFTSRGAILVNLWHGTPIKRIEFDIQNGPDASLFMAPTWRDRLIKHPAVFRGCDFVLSASPFVSEYALSSAFRLPIERCLSLGYPRNDVLFQDRPTTLDQLHQLGDADFARQLKRFESAAKVVLFLPTWRESASGAAAPPKLDWSRLNEFLKLHGGVFIIKPHPLETLTGAFPNNGDFQHIVVLPADVDVYPLMVFADVLLTDYSSVMFDFCLTGRPIILVAFDIEQYQRHDRGFYLPFKQAAIGRIVSDSEQLMTALDDALREPSRPTYDEESVGQFNSNRTQGAADRVASYFSNLVQGTLKDA